MTRREGEFFFIGVERARVAGSKIKSLEPLFLAFFKQA